MLNILKEYKFSIILYLSLTLYAGLHIQSLLSILEDLKPFYLLPLPILMYIGTFSFAFPFHIHMHIKKKPISIKESLRWCIKWTYMNITGQNGNRFIEIYAGKDTFKLLQAYDYMAILTIATITIPFLYTEVFFVLTYVLTVLGCGALLLREKEFLDKYFLRYTLASLLKYPIEMLVPLALLTAFGFPVSPSLIFFFTATTCLLYYIPGFKLAGGLLTLYLMIFSAFLGQGVLPGFIAATTLRLSSVFFFVIPLSFYMLTKPKQ